MQIVGYVIPIPIRKTRWLQFLPYEAEGKNT